MKNKTKQITVSIISAIAVAGINYTIIHSPIVFVFFFVLLAHELGHYFTAIRHGGKPNVPFFIPLPIFMIAITKIKDLPEDGIMATAINGPIAGFIAAMFMLLANIIFNFTSNLAIAILAVSELVGNYFGSDGKKYRTIRKKQKLCLC